MQFLQLCLCLFIFRALGIPQEAASAEWMVGSAILTVITAINVTKLVIQLGKSRATSNRQLWFLCGMIVELEMDPPKHWFINEELINIDENRECRVDMVRTWNTMCITSLSKTLSQELHYWTWWRDVFVNGMTTREIHHFSLRGCQHSGLSVNTFSLSGLGLSTVFYGIQSSVNVRYLSRNPNINAESFKAKISCMDHSYSRDSLLFALRGLGFYFCSTFNNLLWSRNTQ